MRGSITVRRLIPSVVLLVAPAIAPTAASAAPPPNPPDVDFTLDAGIACPGFALHVEGTGSKARVISFENGRRITAGQGYTLTFTNVTTGESLTIRPSGSVEKVSPNGDGTITQSTGGNVLILFPSDVPAGPSTIQYQGRIVYTVDAAGTFTLQSSSGTQRDICGELAS